MRRDPDVADALDELERQLDVGARGVEVALMLVRARAPLEDLGPEPVARATGALAELESERQVVDRPRVRASLDADAAEPEEDVRAVEVVEAGPVRDLLGGPEQRQRLVQLAAVHLRPRAREQAAEREIGILGGHDRDLVEECDGVVPAGLAHRVLRRGDRDLEHAEILVAERVRDGWEQHRVRSGPTR